MFWKFSEFWIKNSKITIIFMIVSMIAWVISWLIIPKQYNPEITAPAYNIVIPAPGFSVKDINEYIIKPVENKLNEIDWLEHIYSISKKDYWALTVSFYVWTDREKATTRLYNKISEIIASKPDGMQQPIIKSIDTNEIPVYTFAVWLKNKEKYSDNEKIVLKNFSLDLIDDLKNIPNIWTIYTVWWENNNINIEVDLEKLEAKNTDLLQIYKAIKKNNIKFPGWNFEQDWVKNAIVIDWDLNDISKIKSLVVNYINWSPVLLEEVATVTQWITKEKYETYLNKWLKNKNVIYFWIAKKRWSNTVFVVNDLEKKLKEVQSKIWQDFEFNVIQNEWIVAAHTTNELLVELAKTIFLLFIILFVFLGFKDALSSALSIPLVLALTFVVALVIWDDINRITLFALILVLWMVVDDSIVVVENISRHLHEDWWKTDFMELVKKSVDEIWWAALFSTLTKIMAFMWMFFVTWMMWQYTWPIPKYAIISLSLSLFVAFAVNPYIAYLFEKNKDYSNYKLKEKKESKLIKKYKKVLNSYFDSRKKRVWMKIKFAVILALLFIIPTSIWIFRLRMLPKSDKEQIYLWVDAPRNWTLKETNKLAWELNTELQKYFKEENNHKKEKDKNIVSVSNFIWVSPTLDFANTFRWSYSRDWENYISLKINLTEKSERNINSEEYTFFLRNQLKPFFNKYKEVKTRFLEDPPGPPIKSTFEIKFSWDPKWNYEDIENLTKWFKQKIEPITKFHDIVDYWDTIEKYQNKYEIKLNQEMITRLSLDSEQVVNSIYGIFNDNSLWIFNNSTSKIPEKLVLQIPETQRNNPDILKKISFTNSLWKKVFLQEIAEIKISKNESQINNDEKLPTVSIYWEMWNNSVVYPMINILQRINKKEFWEWKYELKSFNLYEAKIAETSTWKEFLIRFSWEWKLVIDTFADLAKALWLTLSFLFFMVAGNFKSFRMGWIIMMTFVLWFFWILPWFSILYLIKNEYFSATSLIWVIALAWTVIWNWIIFTEYYIQLRKEWISNRDALIKAWITRMKPILLTSTTSILWSLMIVNDPVWWGLARTLILWLMSSVFLTLVLIPVFMFDIYENKEVE